MAELDAKKILPKMILALRKTNAASSFDLADDPLIRADGMREGCHDGPTEEQSIAMVIKRLRTITGPEFRLRSECLQRGKRSGDNCVGAMGGERRPDQIHPGYRAYSHPASTRACGAIDLSSPRKRFDHPEALQ